MQAPMAYAIFTENGNIRIWSTSPDSITDNMGDITPLYALTNEQIQLLKRLDLNSEGTAN
jgi:hypothetical protein